MRYRRSRLIQLSLVLVAMFGASVLASCSESGSDEEAGELTREAYIEQANAICAAGEAKIEAAAPEGFMDGPPTGPLAEEFFQTIMTVGQEIVDDLQELDAPADMESEMESILGDSEARIEELLAGGAEAMFAAEEDPFTEINERMLAQGLTVCAESGDDE